MWSYYGAKGKLVSYYPKPKYNIIREPFAGSARYSLKHFENDVFLYDKYDVIIRIWQYLQQCSVKDILGLPILKAGDKINRDDFDCIEQAWLYGFIIQQGVSTPMLTVSKWGEVRLAGKIKNIAADLFKIKHWKFQVADYTEIPNQECTWFIDPPYMFGGYKYKFPSDKIDFKFLGDWCMDRWGQTIVCENSKADWLPFVEMKSMNGIRATTKEVIYSNLKTDYDNVQQKLFAA